MFGLTLTVLLEDELSLVLVVIVLSSTTVLASLHRSQQINAKMTHKISAKRSRELVQDNKQETELESFAKLNNGRDGLGRTFPLD